MKDHQMVRLASLQHRVARIEKEASHLEKEASFQRIKEKIRSMLGNFGKGAERALLYIPERDIEKAVRELKKNPEFMNSIEKAPPRSSFQKVKEFFTHLFRKEMMLSNTILVIAVIAATLTYFIPGVGITLILLLLGNALISDPGVERERTHQRAQYHARNRLLNDREAGAPYPILSTLSTTSTERNTLS